MHDILEDTPTKAEALLKQFGIRVLEMVQALTDDKSLSLEERRKQQVNTVQSASDEVKLIKLADHCSNIANIPEGWSNERISEYLNWSYQVSSLCFSVSNPLADIYMQHRQKALIDIKMEGSHE